MNTELRLGDIYEIILTHFEMKSFGDLIYYLHKNKDKRYLLETAFKYAVGFDLIFREQ